MPSKCNKKQKEYIHLHDWKLKNFDFQQTIENKLNDVSSLNNSVYNNKEMVTYLNDKVRN